MRHLYLTLIALFVYGVANAQPPAPITGPASTCVGSTIALSDAVAGGIWSSSAPAVAFIDSISGMVWGYSAGTATITYTIGGGSFVTTSISIDPPPPAITGTSTICLGSTGTETDLAPGGIWSISAPTIATVSMSGGVVTGVAVGSATLSYVLPTGCSATMAITVAPTPGPISGSSSTCVGGTVTLTGSGGVTWSCTPSSVATMSALGVLTALAPGTATIDYMGSTGCVSTMTFTVSPPPPTYYISGGGSYCSGGTGVDISLLSSSVGISYQLMFSGVPYGSAVSGAGAALDFGMVTSAGVYTAVATDATTGCTATMSGSATVAVDPLPNVYAVMGIASTCGMGSDILLSGSDAGISYDLYDGSTMVSTLPGTSSVLDFGVQVAPGTYTIVATNTTTSCTSNMTGAPSAAISTNAIFGHITYSGGSPTDVFNVWLIQYNPSDSSITAEDSTTTCMMTGTPYYEFDGYAPGSYLVKAALVGSVAGTSGYIPTYGLSSAHWDSASTVTHTGGLDTMHINMIYGTIPSGPGFISGYVYSGAGRGTSTGAPGMLIYLKNTAGHIITYTYTDASGAYSFGSLANGSYVIYPEAYKYYTTSETITLSASAETAAGINFKQHTSYGTITPITTPSGNPVLTANEAITVFPNPAVGSLNIQWTNQPTGSANITITDITGRVVYNANMDLNTASGSTKIDVSGLQNGMYLIAIKSGDISYNNKIVVQN